MKSIIFDAGPIISLTMNNLLWLLNPLKKQFNGDFYISKEIKKELVDKPLNTKRFEFEALQVLQYIKSNALRVIVNEDILKKRDMLLNLANNIFKAKGRWIKIVHTGEIEGIASAIYLNSSAFVVDERTTRLLIENPSNLAKILKHKLHVKLTINKNNLRKFRKETENIKMIRSAELVAIAYELGLLDKYIPNIPNPKRTLLDSILWGVKLDGCAVSKKEIEWIMSIENKK